MRARGEHHRVGLETRTGTGVHADATSMSLNVRGVESVEDSAARDDRAGKCLGEVGAVDVALVLDAHAHREFR